MAFLSSTERLPPTLRKGCETGVGYQTHMYHGEHSCEKCVQGKLDYDNLYREKTRKHLREVKDAWNEANKEIARSSSKKWKTNNPDKVRESKRSSQRRRRARKFENGFDSYSEVDVLNLYGDTCYLCSTAIDLTAPRRVGVKGWENGLHIDHLIPVSKNGSDTLSNVRPTHGKCNVTKHDSLIEAVNPK